MTKRSSTKTQSAAAPRKVGEKITSPLPPPYSLIPLLACERKNGISSRSARPPSRPTWPSLRPFFFFCTFLGGAFFATTFLTGFLTGFLTTFLTTFLTGFLTTFLTGFFTGFFAPFFAGALLPPKSILTSATRGTTASVGAADETA